MAAIGCWNQSQNAERLQVKYNPVTETAVSKCAVSAVPPPPFLLTISPGQVRWKLPLGNSCFMQEANGFQEIHWRGPWCL